MDRVSFSVIVAQMFEWDWNKTFYSRLHKKNNQLDIVIEFLNKEMLNWATTKDFS